MDVRDNPAPPLWLPIDSDAPLPPLPDGLSADVDRDGRGGPAGDTLAPAPGTNATAHRVASRDGRFWLDGDAVMCMCPDCRAPMSVRVWLMTADCWKCGTTIVLTEEEEQEIRRLLEQRAPRESRSAAAAPAPTGNMAAVAPVGLETSPGSAPKSTGSEVESARAVETAVAVMPARRDPPSPRSTTHAVLDSLLRDTPAWLISLIVHLLLLTILAMCTFEEEAPQGITLSATVSHLVTPGGDNLLSPPQDELQFDLPLPENVDLTNEKERKAMQVAAEDAKELQMDPDVPTPQLPAMQEVKRRLGETGDIRAALAARDPRIRVEMVSREGGTTLTEAAVSRGLRWLAQHQQEDGSWLLHGYDGGGGVKSRTSATGMALLAFLGAGQTHLVGRYQGNVARGLRWLLDHQEDDGDLRADSDRQAGMYAHGQASIALCEAYALTGDEYLRDPAQRALNFIVQSQYSDGGWRYTPVEPQSMTGGDTSVVGWQLMALQSGRAAQLDVPAHTLELAGQFLDRVQSQGGSRYAYRPREGATPTMTAEALLCRIYLGWQRDTGGLREGIDYLVRNHLPDAGNWNIYYWYYGTQTLHHYGGEPWRTWNERMRDVLVFSQETRGRNAGSWTPRGAFADAGGRLYVTALAVCTLEVYYRHLPLFRTLELE